MINIIFLNIFHKMKNYKINNGLKIQKMKMRNKKYLLEISSKKLR